MRGNFGLFCSFSPQLPRTQIGLHCNANEKTNREKGCEDRTAKKLNLMRGAKPSLVALRRPPDSDESVENPNFLGFCTLR